MCFPDPVKSKRQIRHNAALTQRWRIKKACSKSTQFLPFMQAEIVMFLTQEFSAKNITKLACRGLPKTIQALSNMNSS